MGLIQFADAQHLLQRGGVMGECRKENRLCSMTLSLGLFVLPFDKPATFAMSSSAHFRCCTSLYVDYELLLTWTWRESYLYV